MSQFKLFWNLLAVGVVFLVFWLAAGKFFDLGFESGVYRGLQVACGQ